MNEIRLEIEDVESNVTLSASPSGDGAVISLSDDGADVEITLDLEHLEQLLSVLNHFYDEAVEAKDYGFDFDNEIESTQLTDFFTNLRNVDRN